MKYRVTVIEWLSHDAIVEAASVVDAEEKALELWSNNCEHEVFSFDDSGIDGVTVEQVLP